MKKWLGVVIFLLVTTIELGVAIRINYPPTEEQLKVLDFFGLSGAGSLWSIRLATYFLSLACLKMWHEVVRRYVTGVVALWSCFFVFISPIFFVLWLVHPLIVFKILMVNGAIYLFFRFMKQERWLMFGLGMILLTVVVNLILLNRPSIVSKLSLKEAQDGVTVRISSEDALNPRILAPLWWRRVSYNKYFFVYRNVLREILPFFDMETIFFQEVHPMEQKSIVMFYWPEIYLFIVGIYFLAKIKNKRMINLLVVCLVVSLVNYLFSDGEKGLRMVFLVLPISLILAEGVVGFKSKSFSWILMFVIVYSFGINFYDLTARKEYWFDNRPLAYQFWFENLKNMDLSRFSKVQVTTLIGDTKSYCRYYLGDKCDQSNVVFNNFNAISDSVPSGSIYAGFGGEFVGPKFKNDISEDWRGIAQSQGWRFVGYRRLRDTIANQYGNDIGLAIRE